MKGLVGVAGFILHTFGRPFWVLEGVALLEAMTLACSGSLHDTRDEKRSDHRLHPSRVHVCFPIYLAFYRMGHRPLIGLLNTRS